jgi:hypothetical protein
MFHSQISPTAFEVIRHQPSVAVVGLVFTAQKTAMVEQLARNGIFDFSQGH